MQYTQICALSACVCLVLLLFSRRQEEFSTLILLFLYIGLLLYGLPTLAAVLRQIKDAVGDTEVLHIGLLFKCGGVLMLCAVSSAVCGCTGKKEIGDILDFIAVLEILLICRPLLEDLIFAAKEIFGK